MSEHSNQTVILSDAQRAQFSIEVDRFAEHMQTRDLHPALQALLLPQLEQTKESPENTMDFLLTIGREIQGAVQRIHDAADVPGPEGPLSLEETQQ